MVNSVKSVRLLGLDVFGFILVNERETDCDPDFNVSATHTHEDGNPCMCECECEEEVNRLLDMEVEYLR